MQRAKPRLAQWTGRGALASGKRFLNWTGDSREVAEKIKRTKSILKIVVKNKDQFSHISEWVDHHQRIVGLENLIIFDNGSKDDRVLDLLDSISDRATVCQFEGYHNDIHRKAMFPRLFDALMQSSKFYCMIDSDERLSWADTASTMAPLERILDHLADLNPGPCGVVLGVWADNVSGSRSLFRMFETNSRGILGLATGKPLIAGSSEPPDILCHNFQLNLPDIVGIESGNLMVFHMKNLFPEDRLRVNLEKMRQYRRIPPNTADDEAIQMVVDKLRNHEFTGNPLKWAKEINEILREDPRVAPSAPLGGQIGISDNEIIFSDEAFEREYMSFLNSPGLFFSQAMQRRAEKATLEKK